MESIEDIITQFITDSGIDESDSQNATDEIVIRWKNMLNELENIDTDNILVRARCKRLKKLIAWSANSKVRVPSKASLALGVYLTYLGYRDWSITEQSEADIIVTEEKDCKKIKWYFELKETKSEDKLFGAATVTEWRCALKEGNKGHYFFVLINNSKPNEPSYKFYTPTEFAQFTSIPPFKVNFNIHKKDGEELFTAGTSQCEQNLINILKNNHNNFPPDGNKTKIDKLQKLVQIFDKNFAKKK